MTSINAAPEKYKHINFTPPKGVRSAAKRGLEMRKEHGRGGTAVGVARARDLSNGKQISPSTAKRMKAYFDRHQPDQKAEGFDSGEEGYPSAGRVAWLLWGGDAGYAWAKKIVKQMEAADENGKVKSSTEKWPFYKEQWNPGETAYFEYQCFESEESCDAELWYHSHQPVTVIREEEEHDGHGLTLDERIEAAQLKVYRVRFKDGFEYTVLEDELFTDPKHWEREDPPDYDPSVMAAFVDEGKVRSSNCGCAESCECGCQAPGGGQPPSDMTISNLKQIVRDAEAIMAVLHEHMEVMGWAEDKISQAKVMVNSVRNYIENDFAAPVAAASKKPWEEKREPEGKLSPSWRKKAEERAKKANRKYPNQVDNMWAAQQQNKTSATIEALLAAADALEGVKRS